MPSECNQSQSVAIRRDQSQSVALSMLVMASFVLMAALLMFWSHHRVLRSHQGHSEIISWHADTWRVAPEHVASMLERDELRANEVAVNVQAMSRGKPCLLRQLEDAWAICVAPLLGDGVTWRVRYRDLANLLPSERRRAVAAGGHGGEPALGRHDVLARRQEH